MINKPQIYFARSIRGDHTGTDKLFHDAITRAIRENGCRVAFESPHGLDKANVPTDVYIYQRDIAWLNNSQAMVSDVSNASTGVGYEIAYAKHVLKIPILYLAQDNPVRRVSAMITGSAKVVYYLTTNDIRLAVNEFVLREVVNHEQTT